MAGIQLGSGFDLNSPIPLDSRTQVDTIALRDAIPVGNRYEGLQVYVKENKTYYSLGGGVVNANWSALPTAEALAQINTALTSTVKKVNGVAPSPDGNVTIQVSGNIDTTNLATKDELQTKADATQVQAINTQLADKASVQQVQTLNTQLADKANTREVETLNTKLADKLSYSFPTISVADNDYSIYQSKVKNPLGIAYTSEPVGIHINFDKAECKNASCIEVYEGANRIPFQFEEEKHPNPKRNESIGTYGDGSLKSGTIWIMASFTPNQEKVYTIYVYPNERSQTYTESVVKAVVSDTANFGIYTLTANGIELRFSEQYSYLPNGIKVDTVDKSVNSVLHRLAYRNGTYTDVNSNRENSVATGVFVVTKNEVVGNGVIFKDSIAEGYFVAQPNITYRSVTRMYANGKFDIESFVILKEALATGILNGVIFKFSFDKELNTLTQEGSYAFENGAKGFLIAESDLQESSDFNTTKYGITTTIVPNNATTNHLFSPFWRYTTPNTSAHAKGIYWSCRLRFSPKFTTGDGANELLRVMSKIYSVATKKTAKEIKERLIGLTKLFLENPATPSTSFPGANILTDLARSYFVKDADFEAISTAFKNMITTRYTGGTATAFYNKWTGGLGLEFIGRDTAVFPHMLNKYKELGDTANVTYTTNLIHSLADACVQIEAFSGGEGKILLKNTDPAEAYSMNGQSTVMKALHESLLISENASRRACYNRIKASFDSTIKFGNRSPQNATQNAITYPAYHYHCFSLSEYVTCEMPTAFSATQYIYEGLTPSGHCKEIGFNHDITKRGYGLHLLYAVSVLIRTGSLSDLQMAEAIMNFICSKILPFDGFYQFPLDGWGHATPSDNSKSLDYMVASDIILHLIK